MQGFLLQSKPSCQHLKLLDHFCLYNLHHSVSFYPFSQHLNTGFHFSGICVHPLPADPLLSSSRRAAPGTPSHVCPGCQLLLWCPLALRQALTCVSHDLLLLWLSTAACTDGEERHAPPTHLPVPLSIWFLCWTWKQIGAVGGTRKLISLSSAKLLLKFLVLLYWCEWPSESGKAQMGIGGSLDFTGVKPPCAVP